MGPSKKDKAFEADKMKNRELIYQSASMRARVEDAKLMAATALNILLIGETGVGKELFARLIHENSPRKEGPFIAVCASSLVQSLAASELFGHEKGAFTGALRQHKGLFERAEGGTLFIDEIPETGLEIQAMLLRVLAELEVQRVGGKEPKMVDVRIVSATNRPIAEAIEQGKLRQDLYYRLQGAEIEIPPLRERDGDIPLLVAHYLAEIWPEESWPSAELPVTDEAMAALEAYPWPGNIRELQNMVMAGAARAKPFGKPLSLAHLPAKIVMPVAGDDLTFCPSSARRARPRMLARPVSQRGRFLSGKALKWGQSALPSDRALGSEAPFDNDQIKINRLIDDLEKALRAQKPTTAFLRQTMNNILATFFLKDRSRQQVANEIVTTIKEMHVACVKAPSADSVRVAFSSTKRLNGKLFSYLAFHLKHCQGAPPERLQQFSRVWGLYQTLHGRFLGQNKAAGPAP